MKVRRMVNCENCRYWHRLMREGARGECRINPPRTNKYYSQAMWPTTLCDNFCGQGKPAQEEAAE
jgi:hypothetical protein